MKRIAAVAAATLAAGSAWAGTLDRSNQDVSVLFEEGTHARLAFGYIRPDVSGTDRDLGAGTASTGDVADNYLTGAFGYRQQITDALSFGLIVDQPYGADIAYPFPANGGSANLGGTQAILNTASVAAYLRYEFANGFSVHGGLRSQKLDARVRLGGVAYGGLNGYEVDLDGDSALGFQAGVAYERPDIALRVALTYHSEIDHDLDAVEQIGAATFAGETELTTPEALNLDFQTGVAEGTLVFGSIRYAKFSDVVLTPTTFGLQTGGLSLVNIDDALDVRLGVARRITDRFAGLASVTWSRGEDDNVSPLAPTNGALGVTLAGVFDVTDAVTLTTGLNYTRVRDAIATTQVAATDFEDNDAIGVGVQIGYSF